MAIDPDLKSPRTLVWVFLILALLIVLIVWLMDPTGKVEMPPVQQVPAPAEDLLSVPQNVPGAI